MKELTMTEFRQQPGEALLDVRRDGHVILLTKAGKPVAKLVPPDEIVTIRSDGKVNPRDAAAEALLAGVARLRRGAGY